VVDAWRHDRRGLVSLGKQRLATPHQPSLGTMTKAGRRSTSALMGTAAPFVHDVAAFRHSSFILPLALWHQVGSLVAYGSTAVLVVGIAQWLPDDSACVVLYPIAIITPILHLARS